MTDVDYQELVAQHQRRMREMEEEELDKASARIEEFIAYALRRGVQLTDAAFEYSPPLGITASAPGLLRALLDVAPNGRDGLFNWADLTRDFRLGFTKGCLEGPNFIAMAHSSFRRQMHPKLNWAPRFIELFWGFKAADPAKSIALDEDRVRIDLDGPGYAEADTWYGPPFNKDIAQIESGNVKLRPPPDLSQIRLEMFFASAYCVDVKWSQSHGIKTFQALELKTENVLASLNGAQLHPARYLHAEFDMQTGAFRHFDGAVQYLTPNEYYLRRDNDFSITLKRSQHVKPLSKKVFKLNGAVEIDDWVELSSHFFAANPLMFEYFNGAYPERITEILNALQALPEERR
jgi:hypothetical protein